MNCELPSSSPGVKLPVPADEEGVGVGDGDGGKKESGDIVFPGSAQTELSILQLSQGKSSGLGALSASAGDEGTSGKTKAEGDTDAKKDDAAPQKKLGESGARLQQSLLSEAVDPGSPNINILGASVPASSAGRNDLFFISYCKAQIYFRHSPYYQPPGRRPWIKLGTGAAIFPVGCTRVGGWGSK